MIITTRLFLTDNQYLYWPTITAEICFQDGGI
jgi:hypothetical protein